MHRLPVLEQLEEELKNVERELLVDIPKELNIAAAHGDLRENAEYQTAKERQSFLQARVEHLHNRIRTLSSTCSPRLTFSKSEGSTGSS